MNVGQAPMNTSACELKTITNRLGIVALRADFTSDRHFSHEHTPHLRNGDCGLPRPESFRSDQNICIMEAANQSSLRYNSIYLPVQVEALRSQPHTSMRSSRKNRTVRNSRSRRHSRKMRNLGGGKGFTKNHDRSYTDQRA